VSALLLTVQTFAVYAMVICDVFGYEFQGHSKISAYLILRGECIRLMTRLVRFAMDRAQEPLRVGRVSIRQREPG
jgi:hypothetical protein